MGTIEFLRALARVHRGRVFQNSSFVEFITAKPLSGCGWPLDKVEALIKDDPEVLTLWREATVGGQGARNDLQHRCITTKLDADRGKAYTLTRLKREAPELHQTRPKPNHGFHEAVSPYQLVVQHEHSLPSKRRSRSGRALEQGKADELKKPAPLAFER